MVKTLTSVTFFLALLLLITLPFSITLNLIALVLIALWMIILWVSQPRFPGEFQQKNNDLVWLLIPLIYGISTLYSRVLEQAFHQWLNLLPMVILPLFFALPLPKKMTGLLTQAYILSILIAGLLHLTGLFQFITPEGDASTANSQLPDADAYSLIIWSGILVSALQNRSSLFWSSVIPLLFINLCYFGPLSLIVASCLTYLVIQFLQTPQRSSVILSRTLIVGSFIVILSLVYFTSFRHQVSDSLYNLAAIYTREAWTPGITGFFEEIKFNFTQWAKHPFTGVGVGDYIDAIWNEYHDQEKEAPKHYSSQFMHMLVSTGLMALWFAWISVSYWIKSERNQTIFLLLVISVLFFTTPFNSQATTSAFMIAILLSTPRNE
jgi:hypothetical protein